MSSPHTQTLGSVEFFTHMLQCFDTVYLATKVMQWWTADTRRVKAGW